MWENAADGVINMTIIICDDMPGAAKDLDSLLRDSGFNVNTVIFHNGYGVLDYFNSGKAADVCFLDIIMPVMNGVTLAQQLRKDGYSGKIVYLSNSNEYAHESYGVDAFDYLIKPPTRESVKNVLEKLERSRKNADTKDIVVKVSGIVKSVLLRDISHLEVINHKVYIRLKDSSEIEVYSTFSGISADILSDPRFIQCHRSYIINMEDIAEVAENHFVLRSGKKIPITRSYPDTKNNFYKWKFGREKI
jgi:DNA-binding LytR/AlgR family response regulator